MQRSTVTALLVAAMIALAGCSGVVSDVQQNPANAGSGGSAANVANTPSGSNGATGGVTSTGSATVSAEPDRTVITVAVEITADNASTARTQVAERVDDLRAALTDAGYEPTTVSYRLSPEYDHRGDTRDLVGYRVSHVLEFETAPDEAGSAVDLAVDNGATAVYNVQFTLSDEKRAELRDEALAAAVEDSRATAETVAGAANRSVGEAVAIQVGSSGFSPHDARLTAEAADAGGSTSFEPGPVTVTATVTVTYELND